ncbi:hypothetical protein F2Q69_00042301 [Brassica cretica]|uniref:Uncharacterized protein n=1 Tax=Brassica cretica TaxID=69181 RepID=A0A8S9NJ83_BRACR|nr:hypothetical protein F2Q69_00042301 [Brassica cretica]
MKSDMSDTYYHGEEISADTYAILRRHQFNLESLGDRLQRMENTTATMKEKWRRGDEAMRDFTDISLPATTDINILTSVDIHSGVEPKLTSNTKLDTTACLGAWYTWDRILQTSLEDGRCDDIYFPMDLSISALTSKIEAIQGELVEIQIYITRRPEASASIERCSNISTDIRRQTSVDEATNLGQLVPKMKSDMSDTYYHGEEISADTYAILRRHQFNLESLGDRLQRMENTTATMKEKWRRGDEAMRDFTEPVIDVSPAQRQRTRSRKGKGVASENVLGDPPLPEWNPSFSPGERSGTSEVPPPSDFFASLPPGFTTHESLDEESRRKVVAEGSSLISEGMRVFNAALDRSFRESRISHFKAEEAERELFRFWKEVEEQSRRQAEERRGEERERLFPK